MCESARVLVTTVQLIRCLNLGTVHAVCLLVCFFVNVVVAPGSPAASYSLVLLFGSAHANTGFEMCINCFLSLASYLLKI